MLRREYKYLVPVKMIDDLRNDLLPYVELDKYASIRPEKHYTVRSIYYDTINLSYYFEKIDGIKNRKKLRIRSYNEQKENNVIFLEIKRKLENFIDKHRTAVNFSDLKELILTGDIENFIIQKNEESLENAKRFFFHLNKNLLKPTSLVVYEREAFFSKFDSNIRITFDRNLRYQSLPSIEDLFNEDLLKPALRDKFVFEIKFYLGFSEHFQKIVSKYKLNRLAVSKYQICIEADKNFNSSITNRKFISQNPVWEEKIH